MTPLVTIIVGDQSDLKAMELTQDVLVEFGIAYDTVILKDSEDKNPVEKLCLYGSVAQQKGIEHTSWESVNPSNLGVESNLRLL